MTNPTIGRVVYFRPDPVNQPELIHRADVCAVLLATEVASASTDYSTYVNLSVNDSGGESYSRQGVAFVQDGAPVPPYPYAHWMPYQIDAAKMAAVNAAAKDVS